MPKPTSHKRTTPKVFYNARELRQNQTPAEQKLWTHLRSNRLNGLSFRRQHAIGPFIVDFCCPACHLTIELDGHSHGGQIEYDAARTEWLHQHGWNELRFRNSDVEANIEQVLVAILDATGASRPVAGLLDPE